LGYELLSQPLPSANEYCLLLKLGKKHTSFIPGISTAGFAAKPLR
jgi:hypothetical protein